MGDGAEAARAGGAGLGSASEGAADVERRWIVANRDRIREEIQRRTAYPTRARAMGWSGRVAVRFRLLEGGGVSDVRVVDSTGHDALDDSAIDAVSRAAPLPAPPHSLEIVVPVVFDLEE